MQGTSILMDHMCCRAGIPERPQTLLLPSIVQADHITVTGLKLTFFGNNLFVDAEGVPVCAHILDTILGPDKRPRSVKIMFEYVRSINKGLTLRQACTTLLDHLRGKSLRLELRDHSRCGEYSAVQRIEAAMTGFEEEYGNASIPFSYQIN